MAIQSEARPRLRSKRGPTKATRAFHAFDEAKQIAPDLEPWLELADVSTRKQIKARAYRGAPTAARLVEAARWLRRGAARRLDARPDRHAIRRALLALLVANTDAPLAELEDLVALGAFDDTKLGTAMLAAADRHPEPEASAVVWLERIGRARPTASIVR